MFLGTIMPVGFNYAPKGWALCNGQLLGISQNNALFSLLGTYFGGDGRTTFALPDLRGRTPSGSLGTPGATTGVENVTLLGSQIPIHSHSLNATSALATGTGRTTPATGMIFAQNKSATQTIFGSPSNPVQLGANNVGVTGSNLPHSNMQPYLVLNYIIALTGIYPSRS